jgi:quinohemoprotein ethanol dehydrogenase
MPDRFARRAVMALAAFCAIALASCAPPNPAADGGLLADPDNWSSWGRGPGEQHYSPLDQIDRDSVRRLSLAWHYDLPSGNSATGPLAVNGKVFVTAGHSYIRALDAVTGALIWEWDSHTREQQRAMRLAWGSKGIAYWNGKVLVTTEDGRIFALDANTGAVVWEQREFGPEELRNIQGPPRVFDGKLIVGHGGADLSPIRGYVTAYNADTGERLWRFNTIPDFAASTPENEAMRVATPTWQGARPGVSGGGTAWNAFSYDPDLNLIYIGVGNGFPYNQLLRSPGGGDNLFLASIVAVHADTGEYAWHYQVCPAEQWDCTATMDMSLATLRIDGRDRRVMITAPKNGFLYVIDRADGQLISAEPIARVTWAERIDIQTGRPVENPGIRYHGRGMFELWPGPSGAHSWMPQAFSPRTNLVYIPVIENGAMIGDEGLDLNNPIIPMGVMMDPDPGLPGGRRSFLKAWDPISQRARWTIETPGSWPGGVMATAGDLVFQGRIDSRFVAMDARNGSEMWSFDAQAPIVGPPISYAVNGRQYVTVITGSGTTGGGMTTAGLANYRTDYRMPRRVLTFALDGADALPPPDPPPPLVAPDDPSFVSNPALEQQGAMMFAGRYCIVCHGLNAVAGGAAPDLRISPYPQNREAFNQVVRGGALQSAGMPRFAQMSEGEAEAIRQYLRAVGQGLPHSEAAAPTQPNR